MVPSNKGKKIPFAIIENPSFLLSAQSFPRTSRPHFSAYSNATHTPCFVNNHTHITHSHTYSSTTENIKCFRDRLKAIIWPCQPEELNRKEINIEKNVHIFIALCPLSLSRSLFLCIARHDSPSFTTAQQFLLSTCVLCTSKCIRLFVGWCWANLTCPVPLISDYEPDRMAYSIHGHRARSMCKRILDVVWPAAMWLDPATTGQLYTQQAHNTHNIQSHSQSNICITKRETIQ